MPALFFPNHNTLRLVLSSGLVPTEFTRIPALAGIDSNGRVWLDLPELPSREIIATLARVGVQALGGTGADTKEIRCWAELLPLRKSEDLFASGTVLFVGPEREAARFAARLRRASSGPLGIALRDAPVGRTAWIALRNPHRRIMDVVAREDCGFEAFIERSSNVWIRAGWEHPLADHLVVPASSILTIRPPNEVDSAIGALPLLTYDEYRLPPRPPKTSNLPSKKLELPLTLQLIESRAPSGVESLWVLDDSAAAEFWSICRSVDERLLRRLDVVCRACGQNRRTIVRNSDGQRPPAFLPLAAIGYAADSRAPGLYLPSNRTLRPRLRPRDLSRILGLEPGRIVWLEPTKNGGSIPHSLSAEEFVPLCKLVEYAAPVAVMLEAEARAEAFPLGRFALLNESVQAAESPDLISIEEAEVQPEEIDSANEEPSWFQRSLRKLMSLLSLDKEGEESTVGPNETMQTRASPTERRVAQTLASQDALRHGPDWAARRKELEVTLLHELPRLNAEGRSARWASLANVYSKLGNPSDAAVCWMNAAWESSVPPLPWLKQWLAAECQAAKLAESQCVLERWLSERQPGIARVVAAYAAVAGHTQPPTEFLASLPRILSLLDQHFEDLPLRATWLARLAIARVCQGDALGLARSRDRVLVRLADRGPGLDLDEPSFLRFHGSVSSERFQAARKWLESVREKIHEWIQRHYKSGGRLQSDRVLPSDRLLQWAGLVAEREATGAYADFMLAWGLGCLGERIQANNWAARARKRLSSTFAPGVDQGVHAVLGELFTYRVKDAQEGRVPKAGLPSQLQSRIDGLADEFARYAVDRLREHSQILEPCDHIRAYHGRDLKDFWSSDRLGERLFLLADRTDSSQLADEAAALLQLCTATPTTDTVPRVVMTLLEVAPRLERTMQLRVLDLLPTAIDWLEAWLATGRWTASERLDRLNRYRTRMIKSGFSAAATLNPTLVGPTIAQLVRRLRSIGNPIRESILNVSVQVFRSLRRLGLKSEAEALVAFLDPERNRGDSKSVNSLIARLGLSIGWFTAGNEDPGVSTLNEARASLYLVADLNVEERTKLALAYAEALGFAPPGIAHGRLGEIFERLERVKETGSTNRWFTLKPLQLIDIVVRSVVTDEFALGPTVRGWLDDDEFLIRGRIHRDLSGALRDQAIV